MCIHWAPLFLPYATTTHHHHRPWSCVTLILTLYGPTFYQDAFEFIAECGGEAGAPIDEASALQVVIPVISALAHVHALGYAHRGKSHMESCSPSTD